MLLDKQLVETPQVLLDYRPRIDEKNTRRVLSRTSLEMNVKIWSYSIPLN